MDYFVTGTDTDCGKTFVSATLLARAKSKQLSNLAVKPVAAGCEIENGCLVNSDAKQLMSQLNQSISYEQVNPVALKPAIAPHIAAQEVNLDLSVENLAQHCRKVLAKPHDFGVVEGAGGWLVPLNSTETMADLASELQLPVIVVVSMKLGCISHALLTVSSILNMQCEIFGWVANRVQPEMSRFEENLTTLKKRMPGKYLGCIPHIESGSVEAAIDYILLPTETQR